MKFAILYTMKTIKIISLTIVAMAVLFFTSAYSQTVTDYLVLQDIGDYRFKTQVKDFITGQPKTMPGYSTRIAPGHLAGVDHFDFDHEDTTYETSHVNRNVRLAVDVQVTKHAGADSDKWLRALGTLVLTVHNFIRRIESRAIDFGQ